MRSITLRMARATVLVTVAALGGALLLAGCGGGGPAPVTQNPGGFVQVGATYRGRAACRNCHATIDDQYALQDMGDDAGTEMAGANCGLCHVTGYGKPGGYNAADATTHYLDGIGCEECHGPGSKHIDAETTTERRAQITRTPNAEHVCWGCHGDRGKNAANFYDPSAITKPAAIVDDAKLASSRPDRVGTHYAPAAMLLGRSGYGVPAITSPHSTLPNTCLDCHKPENAPLAQGGQINHGHDAYTPNLDRSRPECLSCHTGGRSETAFQDGVKAKLIELGGEVDGEPDSTAAGGLLGAYATANGITPTSNATPDDPEVKIYKAARHNWATVLKDHSYGVHNPEFTEKLLDKAVELLEP